jgi:hypothetical protein
VRSFSNKKSFLLSTRYSCTIAGKSIGYLGSLAIAVNSLAGPAILQLPFQYQQSGLIPTTLCLIGVGILSYFCSMHKANVVSQIPHNAHYDQCVEFSDPYKVFWNHRMYKVTQILFFLCTVCLNVAAIVDTAEVVDSFFGLHFHTYGYNVQAHEIKSWSHGPCSRRQVKLGQCDPFHDEAVYGKLVLTLGYVITAAVFLPICLMDLKENTNWQILGFFILLSVSSYFCIHFAQFGLSLKHVSLWGHSWGGMLGVILFNFTLVLAIPAWLHEKKSHVKVQEVVAHSTILSTLLYICVGALGAMAIPRVNVNILNPIESGAFGTGIQMAGTLFAFFIIGLDIPLFSVLTRYNLTHSGLCSERMANVMVVWIPWSVAWMLYQGDSIGELLAWGGVILTSAIAFVLPLYLALRVLINTERDGTIDVYGCKVTRQVQIVLLTVLLTIACGAVLAAICGQMASYSTRVSYLNSTDYINGTWAAVTALGRWNNNAPMVSHVLGL